MKRILLVLFAVLTVAVGARASQRDSAQAQRIAVAFLQKYAPGKSSSLTLAHIGRNSKHKLVYIFNRANNGGYIMVSADTNTEDVLMYSESGKFDWDLLPISMKTMISDYGRQISFAIEHPELASKTTSLVKPQTAIKPLLKTAWGQYEPYNSACPVKGGKRCATGCVATAMAQVMNFYKYPATGYPWQSMLGSYNSKSPKANVDAVSKLMLDCGRSVKATYGEETSAPMVDVVSALRDKYGYDPSMMYEERVFYSDDEWRKIICAELSSGRPVVYSIRTELGAHTFVCDGINQLGYFHYNMGWEGDENGYYLMSALKPGMAEKFTFTGCLHYIITGIKPKASKFYKSEMRCFESLTGGVVKEGGSDVFELKGKFQNYSMFDMSGTFGCIVVNEATKVETFIPYQKFSKLESRHYFSRIKLRSEDITEGGSYLVYPAYMLDGTSVAKKMRLQRGLQPPRLNIKAEGFGVVLTSGIKAVKGVGNKVEVVVNLKANKPLPDAEIYAFVFPVEGGNSLAYTVPLKISMEQGTQKNFVLRGDFTSGKPGQKYNVAVFLELAGERIKLAPNYMNSTELKW